MTELMLKMTFWLIAAMLLGFIVAWLLSKIVYKNKYMNSENSFSAIIFERNNMISKLEKKIRNEKIMFKKLSNDFEESRKFLSTKTSLLTSLQHKLNSTDNNGALKREHALLKLEVEKLKEIDLKRLKELIGFEDVLVRAEEKLVENETNYKQILKSLDEDIETLTLDKERNQNNIKFYQKSIADLNGELKLYRADKMDDEFIISKDQFMKIEEQLEKYQEDISLLKNENNELKSKKSLKDLKIDKNEALKEVVDTLQKEGDDTSMVKVFRETYKKITKS